MSELTLLLLRIGFLALMWIFVFAIVYALRSDLFGARARRLPPEAIPTPAPASAAPSAPASSPDALTIATGSGAPNPGAGTPTRLVITSGPREGTELELGTEPLTIGRSAESGLVIRDEYTSTHHARLMLWGDEWMVQDLDSTNGTFLDGHRVTMPTAVQPGVPVRIGTTTFELKS